MIPVANYTDFDGLKTLAAQIRNDLVAARICLIRGFPVEIYHQQIEQLVTALGTPLNEARNINAGMVYAVTPDLKSPLPAYADTPYAFDCHTDCAEFEPVPGGVLLFCQEPAQEGGETLWVDLQDVLPALSFETLLLLQKPIFNFKGHFAPVLWVNPDTNIVQVRYHGAMLTLSDELNMGTRSPEVLAACHEFEQKARDKTQTFKMNRGDCLVLNNLQSLHGRQAFFGHRLFKRARFYLE